ncbi:hypothetical protein Taro_009242 [Colocasia esculenta]|uniref:Uncharacterized protein n=1 Tax=Colocasia esculenta TaxID=4460 RepID=A0A843U4E6_COLES|nr:hypothetical protein [Colocasia esculenta]
MSGCHDLIAAQAPVVITAEGLHFVEMVSGALALVVLLGSVVHMLGAPGSEVSQARGCARGLSRYSGIVRVLSSFWTPSLLRRVVIRLRERRQGQRLVWWFGWPPQFLFGLVERQLDLSSVAARLRGTVPEPEIGLWMLLPVDNHLLAVDSPCSG